MLFSRKGKLRKEKDEEVISLIQEFKKDWANHRKIVDKSIEPSDELMYHYYLSEVRYFYVMREAKARKVSMS